MATRSMIVISTPDTDFDGPKEAAIYQHWDGYPAATLPLLEELLERCPTNLPAGLARTYLCQKRQALYVAEQLERVEALNGLEPSTTAETGGFATRTARQVADGLRRSPGTWRITFDATDAWASDCEFVYVLHPRGDEWFVDCYSVPLSTTDLLDALKRGTLDATASVRVEAPAPA